MSHNTLFPWVAAAHLAREAAPGHPAVPGEPNTVDPLLAACELLLGVAILALEQQTARDRRPQEGKHDG